MRQAIPRRSVTLAAAVACLSLATSPAVVTANDPLPQDRGATGTWQKLLKLRTIASVMHTTAHPDDEHGGLLTGGDLGNWRATPAPASPR